MTTHSIRGLLIDAICMTDCERGDDESFSYVQERREEIICSDNVLPLVIKHFHQALTHRKWIYHAFLLVDAGACFLQPLHAILKERILKHDLSKFSAEEVLGYALKFGGGTKDLEGEDKVTWEGSLSHHLCHNDHHPQFYCGKDMQDHALFESMLDMLACRMERDISCENTSVKNIFAIPDMYLLRYSKTDRKRVSAYLRSWCESVTDFIVTTSAMSPDRVDLKKLFLRIDW